MSTITIQVAPLPHFEGLALPAYETALSAGMDLRAAVAVDAPMTLAPGERALVPTGL
ncbi:MAG TPA: dUTP diphosphatase, partial [Terricaulis sp.]|nr:dUTP diphosphatase [Terricaulis sp.]